MCEQCFLKLSEVFKKMSEQAEKDGEIEIADGLADLSLLAFTSSQLKNLNVSTIMLGLLTLASHDQLRMIAVARTIEHAVNQMIEESGFTSS